MWWRSRNVLLISSIVLALLAGQAAPYLEPLVLPALGLVMTLALLEVSGASFRTAKGLVVPVLVGLGLNFGINGGLVLALSALLNPGQAIFTGFVLIAAAPPAMTARQLRRVIAPRGSMCRASSDTTPLLSRVGKSLGPSMVGLTGALTFRVRAGC